MFGFGKKEPRPTGQVSLKLKVVSFDILPAEKTEGPVPSGSPSPYRVNLSDEQGRKYFIIYYVSSLPPDAYQNHTLDQIRKSNMQKGSWYHVTGEVGVDGQIVLEDSDTIVSA